MQSSKLPLGMTVEQRMEELKEEIAERKAQLGGQNPELIIQRHIKLLHRYNEIKDGAQSLIAAYAQLTQTTIKGVHEELGLPLTD